MRASFHGCSHIVKLLLDWRDELGVGVDLIARDIYGETALIKAAKYARIEVIELLLQRGCLDEFHDHRGFYALHAVIYGSDLISNASTDFLALIRLLGAEETTTVLKRYAEHSRNGNAICVGWTGNNDIQKTMSMLVTSGQAKINSKDFRGNTVLDVALESKLRINHRTVEKLKEYGATSESPEYPENTLHYTDKLRKTALHRLSAVLPELTLREKVEIFDFKHLLNNSPRKEALEEMTVAKDHRARTVVHYAVMPTGRSFSSDDIYQLINVLKLEPTIHEIDNYGRTPLHYCQDEGVYKSLVEQGANEHIPDIDGKTPRDLKKLRKEEQNRHNLTGKVKDQVYPKSIGAWMTWNDSEYAYRDQFSAKICDKVRQFMNRLQCIF